MNRLQKKCLIAVAGTHLLLVVLLLCSGFIRPQPKADDSQLLTVIPANIIAAALSSGVRNAQPPPPQPIVKPETQPQPQPEPPKPEVKHSEPVKPVEPVKPPDTKSLEPVEPKPKPQPHKIEVNLKPVVRKTTPADNSADGTKSRRGIGKSRQARRGGEGPGFSHCRDFHPREHLLVHHNRNARDRQCFVCQLRVGAQNHL